MRFTILVKGLPCSDASSRSALHYARAVLAQGHDIYRVFFYQDGVNNANALVAMPQDETDQVRQWSEFGQTTGVELVACIASCLRRGILDASEAERYQKPAPSLAPGFQISGLGQLIDACLEADRVMTFGG